MKIQYLGLLILGFLLGISLKFAEAHPCNDNSQQLRCHYVQVVSPLDGKLRQEYICE